MPASSAIHILDLKHLGQPQSIAAFLIKGPRGRGEGAVLIETGPGSTYKNLLAELERHRIGPADLRAVLLTHIHLDHAGAAGHLAAEPSFEGRIYVHGFGAHHLIDPSRLLRSANRIYGSQMDRLWGTLLPIPEDRVVPLQDGDAIDAAGLHFTAIESPGHARHHCCFALRSPIESVCFTGDVAGMVVPQHHSNEPRNALERFINLPTPPPEFDLTQWTTSIDRIDREQFHALYLTHFGRVENPQNHLAAVRHSLEAHSSFISDRLRMKPQEMELANFESSIFDEYRDWVRENARIAGVPADLVDRFVTDTLLQMNITGIVRYLTQTT